MRNMKKGIGNSIVFICAMVFLITGLTGRGMIRGMRQILTEVHQDRTLDINIERFSAWLERIDEVLEESLSYHDWLLDLDSIKQNLEGTRIVVKPDMTVVKTQADRLASFQEEQTIEMIQNNAAYFENIQKIAEENGARFLCCPVPQKAIFETPPSNIVNYNRSNYEKTLKQLEQRQIPYLDLCNHFNEESEGDLYFVTDHHWKPLTGFDVSRAICEKLQQLYGFNYQKKYTDLSSYEVKTLRNWFLGALGKKTGRFFVWSAAEDFDLIIPKFETELTEEIPAMNQIRKGDFQDVIFDQKFLIKDYYHSNTYAAYSGGDHRLQIYRNHKMPEGPKIVVVRTSYACVVTPFLALQFSQLHLIDDREGNYPEGDIINLEDYLKTEKPEYVLVIESLT